MDIIFNNALAWVQHQLLGGWRRSVVIGAVYLCAAMGLLLFSSRIALTPPLAATPGRFCAVALLVLLGVQGLMLMIAGSGWVRRAVQRDFTSGMIDSHRLTPMTGWSAVFGYLLGPNLTFVPLTLVNLVLSVGLSVWGGYPIWGWPIGLCLIVCEALCIAALSLLMALSTKGSTNIIGLIVMATVMGGGVSMFIVPGLGVLSGVFAGAAMIRMATGTAIKPEPGLVVTVAGQIALALIVGKAASRKYLRSDVQAFSWPLGLLMLAFVMLIGGLGLRLWNEHYAPLLRSFEFSRMVPGSQWVATLTITTLFAILPLASALQSRAVWERQRLYYPEGAGRRPRHVAWVLLLAFTLGVAVVRVTLGPAYFASLLAGKERLWPDPRDPLGLSLLVFVLALLPILGILRMVYRVRDRANWFVSMWVVAAWAGPAAVDLIRAAYSEDEGGLPVPSWLMGCSPPGAWFLIWMKPEISAVRGVIVQAALAVLVGFVAPMLKRRAAAEIAARPAVGVGQSS